MNKALFAFTAFAIIIAGSTQPRFLTPNVQQDVARPNAMLTALSGPRANKSKPENGACSNADREESAVDHDLNQAGKGVISTDELEALRAEFEAVREQLRVARALRALQGNESMPIYRGKTRDDMVATTQSRLFALDQELREMLDGG